MTAPILNHHHDRLTRRSIFVGAAVSLLYAPAIVRATSLMPVHGVILPTERPLRFGCQYAGFCERLMGTRMAFTGGAVLIHGRADPQKSISDQESGYRSETDRFNHALEPPPMAQRVG
jgi:hypothetical protein